MMTVSFIREKVASSRGTLGHKHTHTHTDRKTTRKLLTGVTRFNHCQYYYLAKLQPKERAWKNQSVKIKSKLKLPKLAQTF